MDSKKTGLAVATARQDMKIARFCTECSNSKRKICTVYTLQNTVSGASKSFDYKSPKLLNSPVDQSVSQSVSRLINQSIPAILVITPYGHSTSYSAEYSVPFFRSLHMTDNSAPYSGWQCTNYNT